MVNSQAILSHSLSVKGNTQSVMIPTDFLLTTARNLCTKCQRNGDIVNECLHGLLQSSQSAVKDKIDATTQTDLNLSEYNLKEGINFLRTKVNYKTLKEEALEMDMKETNVSFKTVLEIAQATFGNIETAGQKFNDAQAKALGIVHATEQLQLKYRICAAKIYVVSTILLHLTKEEPQEAMRACFLFLNKFNSLPQIQVNLSLFLEAGAGKFLFMIIDKSRRLELEKIVKSIALINSLVYELAVYVNGDCCSKLTLHGIYQSDSTVISPFISLRRKEFVKPPDVTERTPIVVKGRDLITVHEDGLRIKVISKKGERTISLSTVDESSDQRNQEIRIKEIAVDKNNKVYVLRLFQTHGESMEIPTFVLNVLDSEYREEVAKTLHFAEGEALFYTEHVDLAVDERQKRLYVISHCPVEHVKTAQVFSVETGEHLKSLEWKPHIRITKLCWPHAKTLLSK